MKNLIYVIFALLTLFACGRNDEKSDRVKEIERLNSNKNNVKAELTKKYNIQYSFDTIDYDYSIQFTELLSSKYQLISDITVHDICLKNGVLILSIQTGFAPTYYFDLSISKEQAKQIIDYDKSNFYEPEAILVIQTFEVCKMTHPINYYDMDEVKHSYLNIFSCKGQVLEIQLTNL